MKRILILAACLAVAAVLLAACSAGAGNVSRNDSGKITDIPQTGPDGTINGAGDGADNDNTAQNAGDGAENAAQNAGDAFYKRH